MRYTFFISYPVFEEKIFSSEDLLLRSITFVYFFFIYIEENKKENHTCEHAKVPLDFHFLYIIYKSKIKYNE